MLCCKAEHSLNFCFDWVFIAYLRITIPLLSFFIWHFSNVEFESFLHVYTLNYHNSIPKELKFRHNLEVKSENSKKVSRKVHSLKQFTISLWQNLDGTCIQSVSLVVDEDARTEVTLSHLGEVFVAGQYRVTLPYSNGNLPFSPAFGHLGNIFLCRSRWLTEWINEKFFPFKTDGLELNLL